MGILSRPSSTDAVFALYGAALFVLITMLVASGHPWLAFVMTLVLSPITFGFTVWMWEAFPGDSRWKRVRYVFDPRHQYWSFLADIALAYAVKMAAQGDRSRQPWLFHQWWWFVLAYAVGVGAALVFHHKLNKPEYVKYGNAGALDSPSFRYHSIGIYPALFGLMIGVAFPYFWSWGYEAKVILACAVIWAIGATFDVVRNDPAFGRVHRTFAIDIHKVHIAFDPVRYRPITSRSRKVSEGLGHAAIVGDRYGG